MDATAQSLFIIALNAFMFKRFFCAVCRQVYISPMVNLMIFFWALKPKYPARRTLHHWNKHMVIFVALLVTHRPANTQIIFTITTPETIESKQRQGDERKTIGELINTNEPFCLCLDAHPHFFYA